MIKCVAIDDEPIALSIIREYCKRYGDIDLQCFTSPAAGLDYVRVNRPDIVFLDIEMNSISGLALARELPRGVCLIFTTAYSQYALDGFNADAVDFLHKPIFYPRFERAMEKARAWMRPAREASARKTITLKVEHRNVLINLDDILFIEAMDNYVKIYRKELPMVMSQITMKEMETMLPPDRFVRVHRSFIVSLGEVESFTKRSVTFRKSDRTVPIGRKYVQSFHDIYTSTIQNDKQ